MIDVVRGRVEEDRQAKVKGKIICSSTGSGGKGQRLVCLEEGGMIGM